MRCSSSSILHKFLMQILAHEQKAFLSWMRETGNMFTGDEYHGRLGIWLNNKRYVQQHNAGNFGFLLAMNHLAHLTPAEYKSLLGLRPYRRENTAKVSDYAPPKSIDWREKGVVNPVKDQGQCGSCWAFSAIQAMESVWAINHNTLYSLSEQNMVDCCYLCMGCAGGIMDLAYKYAKNEQGGKFMTEADYPYHAIREECKFDKSKAVDAVVTGFMDIAVTSERDLAAKVAQYGPAAIGIDASQTSFHLYSSGIYDDPHCTPMNIDHGVGCVGYGSENGVNYWIVRNSWGPTWGEKGYIRMVKDKDNQCGEASMAVIPTVA